MKETSYKKNNRKKIRSMKEQRMWLITDMSQYAASFMHHGWIIAVSIISHKKIRRPVHLKYIAVVKSGIKIC